MLDKIYLSCTISSGSYDKGRIENNQKEVNSMSKSKDSKNDKSSKKKPLLTQKEKRQQKQEKRQKSKQTTSEKFQEQIK